MWLDDDHTCALFDLIGERYVLLLGADVDAGDWQAAVDRLGNVFPIELRQIPALSEGAPYQADEVVLLRPDAVIVNHWRAEAVPTVLVEETLRHNLPIKQEG